MRAAVALFVPRALAGIMGVDREGGYAIPFLTRVGGDHARWEGSFPTTRFALPVPRGSHALGGIACASWTRISSIIPYSVRAESMTSLFTSELRLATLFPAGSENQFNPSGRTFLFTPCSPRAVSIRMAIVETAADHICAESVPNCTPGTD